MNTMDALRVSVVEAFWADLQRCMAKHETALEVMNIRETTDECPLIRAHVWSIACSAEAAVKQLKQKLTDPKGT